MGDNYEKNIYQRLEESVFLLQNGKAAEKKVDLSLLYQLKFLESKSNFLNFSHNKHE